MGLGHAIVADIEQAEISIYQEAESEEAISQSVMATPLDPAIDNSTQPSQRLFKNLIGLFAAVGTISAIIPYQQWQADQSALAELDRIQTLSTTDRQACIDSAAAFAQSARQHEAQTLLTQCTIAQHQDWLEQAKNLAKQRKLQAAIALADQIPPTSNLASEANQLIYTWSTLILQVASNNYEKGRLRDAIAIASVIPKNTKTYQQGQQKIKQWNQDWKANQTSFSNAKKAQTSREWQTILNAGKQIKHPYWKKRIHPLIAEAQQAQQAIQARLLRASIAHVERFRDINLREIDPLPRSVSPLNPPAPLQTAYSAPPAYSAQPASRKPPTTS
ncbi:MAG: hypothetical protein HC936_07210, partial [Leptolyngbyaceae cyanobacterium SU_3_3]|nr:hypothetical protein [Leptolyngbyaceae cyanobacterium SU_3_3]